MKTEKIEELYEDFIEADESFNKRKSKNNKEKLIKSIAILQNSLSMKKREIKDIYIK